MIHFSKVCLDTFGYVLPPRVISSDHIEQRLTPVYERLRLPKGRLEVIPRAGHSVMLDNPKAFQDALLRFALGDS